MKNVLTVERIATLNRLVELFNQEGMTLVGKNKQIYSLYSKDNKLIYTIIVDETYIDRDIAYITGIYDGITLIK